MVFPWSLNDSKFPHITCILADLNNAVILIIKIHPPIFNSVNPRSKRANYSWYHPHPHVPQFCQFSRKVWVLASLFAFFEFHFLVCWDGKVHSTIYPWVTHLVFIPFMKFCSRAWCGNVFLFVLNTIFFFFHLFLFYIIRFKYSQVHVIFLFSSCSYSSLIW